MRRVLVIGCSGAGKSHFARELGRRTGLPVHHLDALFWLPGWEEKPRDAFDAELVRLLAQDAWILDGNFTRTLPARLVRADTVIRLDYARWRCLWGVVRRRWRHRGGRIRTDMAPGCPERLNLAFLRYVWRYNRDIRPRLTVIMETTRYAADTAGASGSVEVLTFAAPHAARRFLKRIASSQPAAPGVDGKSP